MRLRLLPVCAFLAGVLTATVGAQSGPERHPSTQRPVSRAGEDQAPHREGFVARDGVRIHFLDWGGTGEPLILLAGLGSTAHTFDEFAPRLTPRYRVIAVTRRGFGQSDWPARGYDTPSLAADVIAVLDTLQLGRVTVVGHSMGGAEAVWLAVHVPTRVVRVVMLESYCYQCNQTAPLMPTMPAVRAPTRPSATKTDFQSVDALRSFNSRVSGATFPTSELAVTHAVQADGRITGRHESAVAREAVRRGLARSELERVRQPTLLLLAVERNAEDAVRWLRPLKGDARVWAEWSATVHQRSQQAWATAFKLVQPNGVVEWIPGGVHQVYTSDPVPVVKALQRFVR